MLTTFACLLLQDFSRDAYLESLQRLRDSRVTLTFDDADPGMVLQILESSTGTPVSLTNPEEVPTVSIDADNESAYDALNRVFAPHDRFLQYGRTGQWALVPGGRAELERRGCTWTPLEGRARDESEAFLRGLIEGLIADGRRAFTDRVAEEFRDLGSDRTMSRQELVTALEGRAALDLSGLRPDDLMNFAASAYLDAEGLEPLLEPGGAHVEHGDRVVIGAPVLRYLGGEMIFDDTLPLWIRRIDGEWKIVGSD